MYLRTDELPKTEAYGLSSQMRRAAVSIPSNIANILTSLYADSPPQYWTESKPPPSSFDYSNHKPLFSEVRLCANTLLELETQIIIASRNYPIIGMSKAHSLLIFCQKMLYQLIRQLTAKK